MLMLDQRRGLRTRAMRAFSARPDLFAKILAMHTGGFSAAGIIANGLALGWGMLTL